MVLGFLQKVQLIHLLGEGQSISPSHISIPSLFPSLHVGGGRQEQEIVPLTELVEVIQAVPSGHTAFDEHDPPPLLPAI